MVVFGNCKYIIVKVFVLIRRQRDVYGGYNIFHGLYIIVSWVVGSISHRLKSIDM